MVEEDTFFLISLGVTSANYEDIERDILLKVILHCQIEFLFGLTMLCFDIIQRGVLLFCTRITFRPFSYKLQTKYSDFRPILMC